MMANAEEKAVNADIKNLTIFLTSLAPVTPESSPRTSWVLQFHSTSIFGVAATRSCMALDARKTSLRTII